MKKMMIFVAISALMAQLGCWAIEGDRQIPELEQSLEWRPDKNIEAATANNRLIVQNMAKGWSGPWRLHIKWYLSNPRAPRGLQEFDQILEYGEKLLLGPIADVVMFAYAAHGQFWGKSSLKYQTIPRWFLAEWQIASKGEKDIVATISTDWSGTAFQVKPTYPVRPAKAQFQVAAATGKLLDAFPTVKVKVLEKFSAEQLSRMNQNQIKEALKKLQEVGFIQPRHFLGLPDGLNDRNIIHNVYVLRRVQLENLRKVEPFLAEFVNDALDYLDRAYNKMK